MFEAKISAPATSAISPVLQIRYSQVARSPVKSESTPKPASVRVARGESAMWLRLFKRLESTGSLQSRIRDMLTHAVHEGILPPGAPVPSTRLLAHELGVSRLTVTRALEHLCDNGLLIARARSGHYVSASALRGRAVSLARDGVAGTARSPSWESRLKLRPGAQRNISKPRDWQTAAYPFIYGQFDASLFPLAQWRECALESMHARAIMHWAPDHIDRDHEPLIDQIQQRLLPARGIWAKREEILVTSGAQHATFLLAQLLVGPRTMIGMEDPGYPDARNNFLLRTAALRPLAVDAEGLVVDARLARCRYVYVTPSHQCPTTVTMTLQRRQKLLHYASRHDIVVIEDDHESELNFSSQPTAALKSLDTDGRVIYIGSLSKTLAHGLRLGYMVAPVALIAELRALRRLMLRHPATNNEHTAARFIAHGFHEVFVRRLNTAYRERANVMQQALRSFLPQAQFRQAQGGSALWVELPAGVDTQQLAAKALVQGIIIEPGAVFFAGLRPPARTMRLGYSSIAADRIAPGIAKLAGLLQR